MWNNFTTYFNLYYNASRLFNETEQDILQQRKTIFTLQEPRPSGNTSQNLTKVIEKCSKLLQFDATSGYVDDALLIIGKSFYYQQDYQKALRKFTELVSTFPNSDLALEDQLWIAKTQLRLKNYTQANSILEQVRTKAQEDKNRDILTQIYIEQISFLAETGKYNDAIVAAQNLVESSGDQEISAAAMYETGILYMKIDQPENAAKAFADVQKYDPNYETEYLAKIQYGKVQRQLGKSESALEIFQDIESEAKYNQYLDSTKLQIGLTYMDLKKYDDAVKQLAFIDTTFKQSPNAGVSEYYLGEIMEKQLGNYDSAGYYYKKASSASTAPQEFVQKSNRKVQTFTKYDNLHTAINQLEHQLVYIEKPEEFVKDSVDYAKEIALQDSLNKEKQKQKNADIDELETSRNRRNERQDMQYSQAVNQQNKTKVKLPPVRPQITADSVRIALAKNEYELGGLFFTEINVPDSAYYYYSHILNEYPNTSYVPRALYALGTYYQTKNDTVKADSLFNVIYTKYPNESIVNAAADKLGKPTINLKYDAAEDLYVAAEKKMKDKNFNDAVSGFEEVYKKYPKSPFAPKALFATGWVLENDLKKLDSAAAIYDSVVSRYPMTQYANAVKGKVTVYKEEQKKIKDAQDSAKAKLNPPVKENPAADSLKVNNPKLNNPQNQNNAQLPQNNAQLPQNNAQPQNNTQPQGLNKGANGGQNNNGVNGQNNGSNGQGNGGDAVNNNAINNNNSKALQDSSAAKNAQKNINPNNSGTLNRSGVPNNQGNIPNRGKNNGASVADSVKNSRY